MYSWGTQKKKKKFYHFVFIYLSPAQKDRLVLVISFLAIAGKISVMIGTLLYVFGSCKRH